MKIILLASTLTILIFSCSPSKSLKVASTCNENKNFRIAFFQNIDNVESLISKEQNKSFRNSLQFISEYTHVSFEDMANYARIYPTGSLEKDKKVWLEWYESNRCNNIQFK